MSPHRCGLEHSRQKILSLQALRALAALSIAILHITNNGINLVPSETWMVAFHNKVSWDIGVDVFFVISGFVIVRSSKQLFGTPGGFVYFITRRLVRIVPLYWLMTTLFLGFGILFPKTINGTMGGALYLLASYLFIPYARPDGLMQPALGLGWTLNYEVFFYAIFAPCLRFSCQKAVFITTTALVAIVFMPSSNIAVLRYWANPMVLEFCSGMVLALAAEKIVLSTAGRLSLVFAAIAVIASIHGALTFPVRAAIATALVAASTFGRRRSHTPMVERWVAWLGDASYALYLVHPFVMRGTALVFNHLHFEGRGAAYLTVSVLTSQGMALVLHRYCEIPMNSAFRRALEDIINNVSFGGHIRHKDQPRTPT